MRFMTRLSIARFAALVAIFFLGTLTAAQQPAPAPPGTSQGTIVSEPRNECFAVKSGSINQVCGTWRIHWKLWSLMGEPVGNYHLSWQIQWIRIGGKTGYSNLISVGNLPAPIKRAAAKAELYIDAASTISSVAGAGALHPFNTGVAVQSGGEASYNVPGSPDWGKVFISSFGTSPCNAAQIQYMSAEQAKSLWKKGINLSQSVIWLCPQSGVGNLEALNTAIADDCEQNKGASFQFCKVFCEQNHGLSYDFCKPHKVENDAAETKGIDDAFASLEGRAPAPSSPTGTAPPAAKSDIDTAFATMEAEKRAEAIAVARERARRGAHEAVIRECTSEVSTQNACLAKSCGSEPDARICTKSEIIPGSWTPCEREHGSCIIFPKYRCISYSANPKLTEWKQCTANLDKAICTPGGQVQTIDSCVAKREQFTPAPPSLLENAKRMIREKSKCDPTKQKCPNPKLNGGSGRRG